MTEPNAKEACEATDTAFGLHLMFALKQELVTGFAHDNCNCSKHNSAGALWASGENPQRLQREFPVSYSSTHLTGKSDQRSNGEAAW